MEYDKFEDNKDNEYIPVDETDENNNDEFDHIDQEEIDELMTEPKGINQ